VSPIPTSFHLGPLVFHLYGFGLAIAAYVAYSYARRRLARAGLDVEPFARFVGWLIVSGLIGARAAHVATNWGDYRGHLLDALQIWQGGLASFGGIAFALPVGLYLARRYWPETPLARFTDVLVPALVAGWAIGRVLGPQFMYQGGGHLTHQWFGLRYAGQVGKRVPVPLIQGAEDALLWLVLLGAERRGLNQRRGLVTGLAMTIWGLVRALDERLLLGQHSHSGSLGVQLAALCLAAAGVVLVARSLASGETITPTVDSTQ
jgi:phosphatidylglycerol:prolipoprotein diacylglycerol transferase